MTKPRFFITLLILASSSLALLGQADSALPEEARERLDYEVGKWKSTTEVLDREGNVRRTTHSSSERRYVIPGKVIGIAGVSEDGSHFQAWVYYSRREQKYCLTSIDANGTVMTMRGDLEDPFRWTSEPRKRPDGTSISLRFTHHDIEADSFMALGEISTDGGETWHAYLRQSLTRTGK